MSEGWIYDAPPPPPQVSDAAGCADRGRGGRARGRGQQHSRKQQFRPAMQLENTIPTSSASVVPSNTSGTVSMPSSTTGQTTVGYMQYNAEGYAMSSTYDSKVHPNLHVASSSTVAAIPAPTIQGTNISLDSPEDIAAWIAERKKKWPTQANVEKNKSVQSSRQTSGRGKKRPRDKRSHGDRPNKRPPAQERAVRPVHQSAGQVAVSSLDVALAALSAPIEEEEQPLIETTAADANLGEDLAPANTVDIAEAMTMHSSSDSDSESADDSSSVSSDSDSSDEDDNDAPVAESSKTSLVPEALVAEALPSVGKTVTKRPCKYFRQGRCHHGDNCTFSHDVNTKKPVPDKQNTTIDDRYKWRKRKSLYDRLVENEVAHEKEAERIRLEAERQQTEQEAQVSAA